LLAFQLGKLRLLAAVGRTASPGVGKRLALARRVTDVCMPAISGTLAEAAIQLPDELPRTHLE
jgi:hypothetical protein